MPAISDKAAIRSLLRTDAGWSLYALGDLAPGFFERSKWFAPSDGEKALALVYRAFETPVLFTLGEPEAIAGLLPDIAEPRVYMHVRPEIPPVLETRYPSVTVKEMWRMTLDPAAYRPQRHGGAERLGPSDAAELLELFADGQETGEAPDFFSVEMLESGVFFGIREAGRLASAAGTHLVAEEEGVAAVGCVYTRRERRGRGLAAQVTSAVVEELARRGIPTIGLNVHQRNQPAIRIYERLGFRKHCEYREGLAGG
ncbi:MAG: GNAT family N-acetyltransferase [Bryobacteraceae bacterium]|nr:GNAT family N-acetyltransferase [Bryobacteraceae bacterium]